MLSSIILKEETSPNEAASMEIEAHSMNADDDVQDLISTYLGRIVEASFRLTQDGNSRKEPSFSSNDFQHSLDLIARNLLMACRLDILTLSTEHLPKPKRSPVDLTRDVPRDESKLRPWRRIDYVRKLLRAMAPIAIDVAAHVSSLLVPNDSSINISQQDAEAFFILASVWLPIAPHVTPLASELFKLESFPSPLEHESNQQLSTGPHRIFLLAEASQNICFFFEKRGEIKHLLKWWNWSPILNVMVKDKNVESNDDGDVEMQDIDENERGQKPYGFSFKDATHWHASRVVAYLFQLSPKARGEYFQSLNVRESRKPWVMHPWLLDEEESTAQNLQLQGKAQIWDEGPFRVPSPQQIRQWVPEHPWLVHVGDGIVFVKHDPISSISSRTLTDESGGNKMKLEPSPNYLSATKDKRHNLTRTATTSENLALLGAAMCAEPHPPPILICGPHGSGKSSLIRELALIFSPSSSTYRDQLLEIHVDEETDAKTLIGTYTMTDIPGEFTWKPGALTQAVRAGKWVLMEDIDSVPIEIQASLVKLLEDRVLPLGTNGEIERCHPNFRLFGTCTISANSRSLGGKAGKKVLNSTYWRQVYVKPLPFSELKEIAVHLFPNLPPTICESALAILKALDRSGREVSTEAMKDSEENEDAVAPSLPEGRTLGILMTGGRHPSVRDFFKLLSRISNGIIFERDVKYATESQRTLCMAESVDIFLAACPDRDKRRTFIRNTVAPIWGLTADLALSYLDLRKPTTQIMDDFVEVGRAKLPIMRRETIERTRSETNNFTETSFSLRLMESIAVGIRENEPLLLGTFPFLPLVHSQL